MASTFKVDSMMDCVSILLRVACIVVLCQALRDQQSGFIFVFLVVAASLVGKAVGLAMGCKSDEPHMIEEGLLLVHPESQTRSESELAPLAEDCLSGEAAPLQGWMTTVPSGLQERLVAHRGFHCPWFGELRPLEGTLAAYTVAWRAGVKLCECDVRVTSDGHVVLAHDDTLHTGSETPVSVASSTLEELQVLTLLNGEKVASLAEVLEFALQLDGKMVVELKPCAGVGRAVARLFRARPELKTACEIVMAFGLEDLCAYAEERRRASTDSQEVLLQQGSGPMAMLLTVARSSGDAEYMDAEQILDLNGDWEKAVEGWQARGVDGVYMEWTEELTGADAPQVQKISQQCAAVGVWQYLGQTDHRDEAQDLLALGVSYVNTDLPRGFFGEV